MFHPSPNLSGSTNQRSFLYFTKLVESYDNSISKYSLFNL
ncbi:hypothetical protein LEP1GSC048_2073 [Leptospira santarosai serovar Shermani str. 1342KT]|nr:hypothetical protein LEP1GSC048_2073 [Leptospira santarosai serovar Shermani str. 1342KT]